MAAAPKFQNGDRHLTYKDVLEVLIRIGLVPASEEEKCHRSWSQVKEHPLVLVSALTIPDPKNPTRKLTYDDLMALISHEWGYNYYRVDNLKLSLDKVGSIIPYAYADRLGIVPIEVDKDKVVILTYEPFSLSWIDEVRSLVKRNIEVRVSSPKQIRHLLNEIFVVQKAFKAMAKDQGASGGEKLKLLKQGKVEELDALVEKSRGRSANAEGYISKIVDWLINFASMERASDIHIEPKKGMGQIRFRIDGDLRTVYRLDPEAMTMVIARFKILGEMKLDERRRPQDGGIKIDLKNGKQVEMRLSTLPTNYGEKLVVRIFDKSVAGQDLTFIGFTQEDLNTWIELIKQPQGLILVTGPTGSGKTTTLYTTLNKVATPDVNVCTAEDPIEMEVDSFNQVQVNTQIGLTFAECIRTFLRQDPDIIMVGEIRDFDTGEMAIQSSLTGHLVFSTLHTNGALATIQRLIDLGLPSFLINSSLSGILAQRLVKKLCSNCKKEVLADKNKWETLLDGEKYPMPQTYFEAQGCEECKHTGYVGRVCIYELVKITDEIKKAIHNKVETSELREKTRGLYFSIRVNGARKIIGGETSIEEVLKVVY